MFNPSTKSTVIIVICIVVLIAILCVCIVIIVYLYQNKQLQYVRKIEQIKVDHQNRLMQSVVEIQEQTFQNISKEIHNNIGQKLILANLHLQSLVSEPMTQVKKGVGESVVMISEAMNDLRDISRSMSSDLITSNGIIKALEFEVTQLKKNKAYTVQLAVSGDPFFLPESDELVLFRIAQEALNNIIKHAFATVINIQLSYNVTTLTLHIKDNGVGFKINPPPTTTGGLKNLKNRAHLLKGTCKFSNDNGANIHVEIPAPVVVTGQET